MTTKYEDLDGRFGNNIGLGWVRMGWVRGWGVDKGIRLRFGGGGW